MLRVTYAECHISALKLSVIMPNAIMLSVVMPSVVAPIKYYTKIFTIQAREPTGDKDL